jgi:hypothetical protein
MGEDESMKDAPNIIHDRKIIFLHNPKAAGNSIAAALGITGSTLHHVPSLLCDAETWETYFSILFVRNPYDRLVSSYAYHTSEDYQGIYASRHPDLKKMSFFDYFQLMKHEMTLRPQSFYLSHMKSAKIVDFVGRFEDLATDIELLGVLINRDLKLMHLNKTPHKNYQEYYDTKTMSAVFEYYRQDFQIFGYWA